MDNKMYLLMLLMLIIILLLLFIKSYIEIIEKSKGQKENSKRNQTNPEINQTNPEINQTNPEINQTSPDSTTAAAVNLKYSYANIKTQVGYYFSHDNNIYRLSGKGGFNPGQITELEILDVFDDNTVIKRNDSTIDRSLINFGNFTPENVFNLRNHNETKSIDDFKYEIPIMYGPNPLINSKGDTLKVPAYIGLKGDVNLNNLVETQDAQIILSYYTALISGNTSAILFPTDNNLGILSPTEELENFVAFLADVSENEYEPTNWKKSKSERTLNATDAQLVLVFATNKIINETKPNNDIWNEVIGPSRFGE